MGYATWAYPTCPSCGYNFEGDELEGLVTYWGEGPPVERDCPHCETPLLIDEEVERTFTVTVAAATAADTATDTEEATPADP